MRYLFLLLLFFVGYTEAQTLNWGVGYGNTQHVNPRQLDVDAAGNVAVVGHFSDTLDFDPDTASVHKIGAIGPTAASNNLYIQKLDNTGSFLWVKQLAYSPGNSNAGHYKIKFDALGNIFVTGSFNGTVDFDPGPGTQNVTSTNNSDGYLLKLDANGNFLWVKFIEGNSADVVKEMEIDANGNIYLSGSFFSTIDLDSGPGVQQLTSVGSRDIFLTKWDANGNFAWAHSYGAGLSDEPYAMELDKNENVILVGTFRDTVDFDPGIGTQQLIASANEGFVLKVDPNGNTLFAKHLSERNIAEVALDNDNNILLTGRFQGTIDLDPNAGINTVTSNGSYDVFVAKWDSTGNYVWSVSFGGNFGEIAAHVVADDFNRVFTIGSYATSVDFDPSSNNFYMFNASSDVFLSILDANGGFLDAKRFTSTSTDGPLAMEIRNNCIYATGTYNATMDFAPDDGHYYSAPYVTLGTDAFVFSYCYGAPLPLTDIDLRAYQQNELVNVQWTTYEEKNVSSHVLQWSADGVYFKDIVERKAKNKMVNEYEHLYDTQHSQNYFRVKSIDLDGSQLFSNIVELKSDYSNQLNLYPNPTQTYLETGITESGWDIEVYSMMGQKLLYSQKSKIDVSHLPAGSYILRTKKGNQMKYGRFQKE